MTSDRHNHSDTKQANCQIKYRLVQMIDRHPLSKAVNKRVYGPGGVWDSLFTERRKDVLSRSERRHWLRSTQ